MGSAPPAGTTGLTYQDLRELPTDGGTRFELLDGELLVTPSPATRHQDGAGRVYAAILDYTRHHGGQAFPAPLDVWFSDATVLQPDVVAVTAEHLDQIEADRIVGPPDLVVEVSSPSTRRTDLVRKRRLYEREGVPEFWFVDLDADQVHVYTLGPDGYGPPQIVLADGEVRSSALVDFVLSAEEALALGSS